MKRSLRVLFWGTRGSFSSVVLHQLLAGGVHIAAVFVYAPGFRRAPEQIDILPVRPRNTTIQDSSLDLSSLLAQPHVEQNIILQAWSSQIPVFEVGTLNAPATLNQVADFDADVACVACFDERIPDPLLAVPRLGFLNVHPSLLPHFRGPTPLFWILRDGYNIARQQDSVRTDSESQDKASQDPETGVTIHWMDATFDTGDIAIQKAVYLKDGLRYQEVEQVHAEEGGQLLIELLGEIKKGNIPRTPQSTGGSYQSWPTQDDFEIRTEWSARRAYNFMRGTDNWNRFYRCKINGEVLLLTEALWFVKKGELPTSYVKKDGDYFIQCSPGILIAK
ncbi:hypothetical protein KFU94_24020 [Chloroflexi bacterium TSY]|nr:hypothetical protein [Chloroflexi bacterium TSY]